MSEGGASPLRSQANSVTQLSSKFNNFNRLASLTASRFVAENQMGLGERRVWALF